MYSFARSLGGWHRWDRETPAMLEHYASQVARNCDYALDCIVGFVDGTVRAICRPRENQRDVYNGHYRQHAIKFQSIATPDGLIRVLNGPYCGRYAPLSSVFLSRNFC
jgi:hypothetical protein